MPYPIEKKLVIAVASSALFNLEESDRIFRTQGVNAYKQYQNEHVNEPFPKGVAFPFISRLLRLNDSFPEEQPVEVILISRNSPETGLRAFNSIAHYGLNITRAGFSSGSAHFKYLPAFNATLFLSANEQDVKDALAAGYAAGRVLNTAVAEDPNDRDDCELRIAFDFDGVLADDEAEAVFQQSNDLEAYHTYEKDHAAQPLHNGPIIELLKRISYYQQLEREKSQNEPGYQRILKTAIVTARSAPAHERMINTLTHWNVEIDEVFFLGGIEKARILNIMKPHIFFDDQMVHLEHADHIPAVHIPFGKINA